MSVLFAPLFPALIASHTAVRTPASLLACSSSPLGPSTRIRRHFWHSFLAMTAMAVALLLSGCVVPTAPTPVPSGPSPAEIAKQQRVERALANLADGMKRYDAGAYDESMSKFLLALDSGALSVDQQIAARKQMAFIHCVSNREAACRDEFERIIALAPKFDLPAAEAGHPTWGPVFRAVKSELELRKPTRTAPATAAPAPVSAGDKLMADASSAYDLADYNKAIKSYQDALKETISIDDQIRSRKFIAFSYCLSNRSGLCRAEFEKILQLKPNFELEPAEAGHPSWGPSFRTVKAKQKIASTTLTTPPVKK